MKIQSLLLVIISSFALWAQDWCENPDTLYWAGVTQVTQYYFSGNSVSNIAQDTVLTADNLYAMPNPHWVDSISILDYMAANCAWNQHKVVHAGYYNGALKISEQQTWTRFVDDIRMTGHGEAPWFLFSADTTGALEQSVQTERIITVDDTARWYAYFYSRDSVTGGNSVSLRSSMVLTTDSATSYNLLLESITEESNRKYAYQLVLRKVNYGLLSAEPEMSETVLPLEDPTKPKPQPEPQPEPDPQPGPDPQPEPDPKPNPDEGTTKLALTAQKTTANYQGVVQIYNSKAQKVYQGENWRSQDLKPGVYVVKPLNRQYKSWFMVR